MPRISAAAAAVRPPRAGPPPRRPSPEFVLRSVHRDTAVGTLGRITLLMGSTLSAGSSVIRGQSSQTHPTNVGTRSGRGGERGELAVGQVAAEGQAEHLSGLGRGRGPGQVPAARILRDTL